MSKRDPIMLTLGAVASFAGLVMGPGVDGCWLVPGVLALYFGWWPAGPPR